MGERIVIRRHPIDGRDRPQRTGEIIGAPVAHHTHGTDGQDGHEGLPDVIVKPVFADLVDIDRIRLAQDLKLLAGDLSGAANRKAGAGERVASDE